LSRTGTLAEAGEVGRLLAEDLLEEGADTVIESIGRAQT
jgi:ribosomal protein L18